MFPIGISACTSQYLYLLSNIVNIFCILETWLMLLFSLTHSSCRRAFWDSVRAGLQKDPPDYEHSLRLIGEIKGILLDLVPAAAQRAKDQINEVMDIELYKQQIENDSFNLQGVVKFVVEVMLGLCAPARDSKIRSILSLNDPVEVFKEVRPPR